jgi:hypothetical protein
MIRLKLGQGGGAERLLRPTRVFFTIEQERYQGGAEQMDFIDSMLVSCRSFRLVVKTKRHKECDNL